MTDTPWNDKAYVASVVEARIGDWERKQNAALDKNRAPSPRKTAALLATLSQMQSKPKPPPRYSSSTFPPPAAKPPYNAAGRGGPAPWRAPPLNGYTVGYPAQYGQYNPGQYNTGQYNTVQYNTGQYVLSGPQYGGGTSTMAAPQGQQYGGFNRQLPNPSAYASASRGMQQQQQQQQSYGYAPGYGQQIPYTSNRPPSTQYMSRPSTW